MRIVRRVRRWFIRTTQQRPFVSVLVLLLMIIVPGFARFEAISSQSHDAAISAEATAEKLEKREAADAVRQKEEANISCQTRNTFQKNTRNKFKSFIDAVEVAFTSQADNPQRADAIHLFVQQLRDSVETKPENEDRDCNNDGQFNEADYLPV